MSKYLLFVGVVLFAQAATACEEGKHCARMQDGTEYVVEVSPEKIITDCDPGVDCHHMQSGQHYSIQTPIVSN